MDSETKELLGEIRDVLQVIADELSGIKRELVDLPGNLTYDGSIPVSISGRVKTDSM
jgi:hypothetical protein